MAIDKVKFFTHNTSQKAEEDVNDFLNQLRGHVINISQTFAYDADIAVYNVMIHYKETQKPEPEDDLTEEDRISNGETLERALGL